MSPLFQSSSKCPLPGGILQVPRQSCPVCDAVLLVVLLIFALPAWELQAAGSVVPSDRKLHQAELQEQGHLLPWGWLLTAPTGATPSLVSSAPQELCAAEVLVGAACGVRSSARSSQRGAEPKSWSETQPAIRSNTEPHRQGQHCRGCGSCCGVGGSDSIQESGY